MKDIDVIIGRLLGGNLPEDEKQAIIKDLRKNQEWFAAYLEQQKVDKFLKDNIVHPDFSRDEIDKRKKELLEKLGIVEEAKECYEKAATATRPESTPRILVNGTPIEDLDKSSGARPVEGAHNEVNIYKEGTYKFQVDEDTLTVKIERDNWRRGSMKRRRSGSSEDALKAKKVHSVAGTFKADIYPGYVSREGTLEPVIVRIFQGKHKNE